MVTKTFVTLTCDICGSEDMVESHQLIIDNVIVNGEVCLKDWKKIAKAVEPFIAGGQAQAPHKNGRAKKIS